MESRFVELNDTGRNMSDEERKIAGELMSRYIKRSALVKPGADKLFFEVSDKDIQLKYRRREKSFTCETYHKEFDSYESTPFNWH